MGIHVKPVRIKTTEIWVFKLVILISFLRWDILLLREDPLSGSLLNAYRRDNHSNLMLPRLAVRVSMRLAVSKDVSIRI